jgi:hypothetical protein
MPGSSLLTAPFAGVPCSSVPLRNACPKHVAPLDQLEWEFRLVHIVLFRSFWIQSLTLGQHLLYPCRGLIVLVLLQSGQGVVVVIVMKQDRYEVDKSPTGMVLLYWDRYKFLVQSTLMSFHSKRYTWLN